MSVMHKVNLDALISDSMHSEFVMGIQVNVNVPVILYPKLFLVIFDPLGVCVVVRHNHYNFLSKFH
jgi:hypothetical protein